MASSKKSSEPQVRIFATMSGFVIGRVAREDDHCFLLDKPYSVGLSDDRSSFVFGPILFYSGDAPLCIYKAALTWSSAPSETMLDAYLKRISQASNP